MKVVTIIVPLAPPDDSIEELTRDIHTCDDNNFAEVVKTTLFVDKTMLIKRFHDNTKHGAGILVLAPRHFGKSTNLDMVKRFYEINVDENSELIKSEETNNYKLFRDNYLIIYNLKDFFHKHFGKYPVIHVDYELLCGVKTVEELLAVFCRKVMVKTFAQHKYLLDDSHLWILNKTYSWVTKEKFHQFLDAELNHKLSETDIQTGFSFLARLLHKKFETRVIVLLDNYDAFVESPLYSQNRNIFHFLSAINCDLLRCESIERSLVTGVIRSSGPTVDRGEILPTNVVDSTESHNVWQYFGLSGSELDHLLQSVIVDDEQRQKVMGKIVSEYSGYSVASFEVGDDGNGQLLDTQTCSVWSVLQYMEKEMAVENFSSLI